MRPPNAAEAQNVLNIAHAHVALGGAFEGMHGERESAGELSANSAGQLGVRGRWAGERGAGKLAMGHGGLLCGAAPGPPLRFTRLHSAGAISCQSISFFFFEGSQKR
ncbi:MAG: hypothetical protein ACI9U2_004757 [Bradymonadia bacterium]